MRGMVSAGVLFSSPSERSEDMSAVASFLPCSRSMWRRASRWASSHSICHNGQVTGELTFPTTSPVPCIANLATGTPHALIETLPLVPISFSSQCAKCANTDAPFAESAPGSSSSRKPEREKNTTNRLSSRNPSPRITLAKSNTLAFAPHSG
jgi:hypothetical protein